LLLEHLSVVDLRNLAHVELPAHRRLTVFLGDNGQGKTNLLEAVHLTAALRPLKPLSRSKELIRFGADFARVKGDYDVEGPLPIEVRVEAKGRRATLAGKQVRDVGQVAERIGVVAFTPEDLTVVRQGPDHRRRALDRFAYSLDAGFAAIARRYDKALDQRNRLLKQPVVDAGMLESFTVPLVDAGIALLRARVRVARAWGPVFQAAAARISDGRLLPTLTYGSSLLDDAQAAMRPDANLDDDPVDLDDADLKERFAQKLAGQQQAERMRKTTLSGPHLDDVVLAIDDKRVRHLASQGEARAMVLALKLAEVQLCTTARRTAPLVLLDDVAGELDPKKARCLFEVIDEVEAQAFVTATHRDVLPPDLGAGHAFHLSEGAVVGDEALTP